ncbi:DUF6850 family outer membrane beta-barrel protein [Salinibacter altiplanensis]|uniref:DUF6850 family outer membrane beta-barrel protein n=1 Tax=Salinibacter altiplanensis TaxID=1803181 RepID=UPI000C9F9780|nr:DUF6850 family outer membrane beta-barrel protein [Salinibacter altiplanensis]
MSTPTWLSLRHGAELPVRSLLADTTYSASALQATNAQGPLRTYQDPKSSRTGSLTSYGLTSYRGLRLEGRFEYRKERQNGIGWKLGRNVSRRPYYFANIKPGDWDNDRYEVNLNGGTTFFGDHLLVAGGADYQVERLARYNDPRPSLNYYKLFVEGQVGGRVGSHTLALYYGTGDAEENGNVSNYNRAHDSFGEREYNIITTTGLGSYNFVRFSSYERPTTRTEVGVTYAFDGERIQFTGELVGGRSESEFIRTVSDTRETPGTYQEETVQGTAFLTVSQPEYRLQMRSKTRYKDGHDRNEVFAGANYFRTGWRQNLDLFLHPRAKPLTLQATLDYNSQSVTDRNASHHYEYTWLAPGLSVQYSWETDPRQYTVISGGGYRVPLSQTVRVPQKNRNLYTKHVLAPDYSVHTARVMRLRGGFQVLQRFEDLSVGLLVEYRRRMVTETGAVLGTPEFLPGNVRNTFSFTVQFFH